MSARITLLVLGSLAGLAITHDLAALALDRTGLLELLLSPYEERALFAALVGLVFFALRLSLVVIGPGLALAVCGAQALSLATRMLSGRGRPSSDRPPEGRGGRDPRADHPSDDRRPRPPRSSCATPGAASR